MAEIRPPILRSPLDGQMKPSSSTANAGAVGVRTAEWPNIGCLVLRGRIDDEAFVHAAQSTLSLELPRTPSTWAASDTVTVLWLSPDEWWVLLPHAQRDVMLAALEDGLKGQYAQVADLSGSVACLRLEGPEHVTVLRHLCVYDVESIVVGQCVSTVLPKASWILVRTDDDGVMLVFRRSFANWVWGLVERSAEPYGVQICDASQLNAPHFSNLLPSKS